MTVLALAFILLGASWSTAWAADPPCDKYAVAETDQMRGDLEGAEPGRRPPIAQFGLDQLKRREEGKINASNTSEKTWPSLSSPPKSA